MDGTMTTTMTIHRTTMAPTTTLTTHCSAWTSMARAQAVAHGGDAGDYDDYNYLFNSFNSGGGRDEGCGQVEEIVFGIRPAECEASQPELHILGKGVFGIAGYDPHSHLATVSGAWYGGDPDAVGRWGWGMQQVTFFILLMGRRSEGARRLERLKKKELYNVRVHKVM
jgi:hypothetical protein